MKAFLVAVAAVVALVVLFLVWRIVATIIGGTKRMARLSAEIGPVLRELREERAASAESIRKLAANSATRNLFYTELKKLGKEHLFPIEYHTSVAMAESDLVMWLLHPNELGAKPDEIEMAHSVERTLPGAEHPARYFVFKFRTVAPHWAAKSGWLAGVAGPGDESQRSNGPRIVFSRFESFDAHSPEEHFERIETLFSKQAPSKAVD